MTVHKMMPAGEDELGEECARMQLYVNNLFGEARLRVSKWRLPLPLMQQIHITEEFKSGLISINEYYAIIGLRRES